MTPVVLSAFVIALLIVVVLLGFVIASVRGIGADKGAGGLVAMSTAPPGGAGYREATSAAPAPAPGFVGYLDEGYRGDAPTPPPTPPPASAAPAPAREPAPVAAPAGVGYMDEYTPAPARTPAHAAVPAGVGYMDV